MSDCNHDCSSCASKCSESTDFRQHLHEGASVKKVIAVVSGKGGVGKTLVTTMFACEMQRRGYRAAVLDADITGPSVPKSFGVHERAVGGGDFLYPALTDKGIQIMSINLVLDEETQPVVWRGPVIAGAVTQFWTDVLWDDVYFMFVDMPPGTGDVPLTVFQSLPVDGVIIVTSPQDLVGMIVAKAVNMATLMKIPVLGIVENMSYFKCPDCGKEHAVFGKSRVEEAARQFDIPHTARLPIDPAVAELVDEGKIEEVSGEPISALADEIERACGFWH